MIKMIKYEEADFADWPPGGRIMHCDAQGKIVYYKLTARETLKWCHPAGFTFMVLNGHGFLVTPLQKINVKAMSCVKITEQAKCSWQNMTDEMQSLLFIIE
jgi:hypothetical protein